jgi:hypothetical protein
MPAKATLSPQAGHAIACYRRLAEAEQKASQANKNLNNALARMTDGDMADYYLAVMAEKRASVT